jgi:hypothetical protein
MDFAIKLGGSGRNRGAERLEAGYCDITSLFFHRRGQYAFGLTFHGSFVPPASHAVDEIAQTDQPGLLLAHDEDSISGEAGELRASFPNGTCRITLENEDWMTAPMQADGKSESPKTVPEATILGNIEFDFDVPAHIEDLQGYVASEGQGGIDGTTTNPFFHNSNFPQADEAALYIAPGQQNKKFQAAIGEPIWSDPVQEDPEDAPGANESGQEWNFSETFESTSQFQVSRQESSFSSHDCNFMDSLPPSSQESSVSTTAAASPSTQATTPSSTNSFSDRPFCNICRATFKRVGDLKRHEGVHLPKRFHCKHERQVHGVEN